VGLESDPDAVVRVSLLGNPHFPLERAEALAERELLTMQTYQWFIPQAIAWSTRVSSGLLGRVAKDFPQWYVWIALANNVQCPEDLLVRFARDDNPFREVQAVARGRLESRTL